MPRCSKTKTKNEISLSSDMRAAVFALYGRRCYHPGCRLGITKKNYLVVHDITSTGDHSNLKLQRPICMIHHNRTTAKLRHARAVMRRLVSRGVPTGRSPCPELFEEYYGPPTSN